ncbi:class I adenylate-forming enzyme family protein [Rhizorhapis sp.]|uniref:class I adenylate-forming enzyme family protein n=1 Tax=Rhizorhapis sp. TaxID=1968842 RepID=UPI002B4869C3|nr:AMP-binding protein [Rhizorhapis sp.]HKR16530.1 AMP-binding protein [Rhizorhapis sp.]
MAEPNLLIIANLVAAQAAARPDLDVLTFEDGGVSEVRTYRDLWENGQRLAEAFRDLGLAKGARVALLIQNHPEFVELMIAAAIQGIVIVPIDPRTRGAKLAYMLRDSDSCGIICASYSLNGVIEALGDCPNVKWVAGVDELGAASVPVPTFAMREWLSTPMPEPALPVAVASEAEPMQLMYTSGTTGDPKGIVVPHGRFGAVSGHGEAVFGYRPGDRPYTGLSLTHGNAQFVTLAPSLKMGLRAVISRKFSKSRLWDIVRHHGCTTFSLLGGMVTAIHAEPRHEDDAVNPLRLVVSAGMPIALWEDFSRRFGVEILEFYGAMEGGMAINRPGEGPIGSCGRAAPGLVARIVREDGALAEPNEVGELQFQLATGPFPPVTYHNNPEASSAKVVDGWLQTGDMARMDGDGWLFYEYRKGGGIRRNGEFVSPSFVERVLGEHPGIDDIFVYGVASSGGAPGERDVVAAIVPTASFDPIEVFRWAHAKLERNMVPRFLHVVEQIPKTASEKPQERFLIDEFASGKAKIFTEQGAEA